MKISKTHHVRRKGPGAGKPRKNPETIKEHPIVTTGHENIIITCMNCGYKINNGGNIFEGLETSYKCPKCKYEGYAYQRNTQIGKLPRAAGTPSQHIGLRRKDNPGPLSRISELKRLKQQEKAEKNIPINPIQLPEKKPDEYLSEEVYQFNKRIWEKAGIIGAQNPIGEEAYNKPIPGLNLTPAKILYFEIGTICGNCGYAVGPDWILTDTEIICPKCRQKYERSSFSGGK